VANALLMWRKSPGVCVFFPVIIFFVFKIRWLLLLFYWSDYYDVDDGFSTWCC